jgi:hypothetical protein
VWSVPGLYNELGWIATDRKECYALRNLQRGLIVIEAWCERWNIKINDDKTQAIYFFHRLRPPEADLTSNGRNISFVNNVKYLSVIFDKRIAWRVHTEVIEAKAFRIFIIIYSLFRSECLSANIKLILHQALIRPVMSYACSAWELAVDTYLLKLQHLQNEVLHVIWNFPKFT